MQTRNQLNFMPRSPRSLLLDLIYWIVRDTIPHVFTFVSTIFFFFFFSPFSSVSNSRSMYKYVLHDELSVRVISKLANDVIIVQRDQWNSKNCVFVCLTLSRLITTIFTRNLCIGFWQNFSLTKVNIVSRC